MVLGIFTPARHVRAATAEACKTMDLILHCGAHRTGAAGLMDYVQRHADVLSAQSLAVFPPDDIPPAVSKKDRAKRPSKPSGASAEGPKRHLVSDVSLLGDLPSLARTGQLYPDAGARIAQWLGRAERPVTTILLCIRNLEMFWISALAQAVAEGAEVPDCAVLRQIARENRSWRDVITDVAKAAPEAEVRVLPFETFRGQPERFLGAAFDIDAPQDTARTWLNRAPLLPVLRRKVIDRGGQASDLPFGMGPWNPFCAEELAALRERMADDMMWLMAGADGLATLTEDRPGKRAGKSLPSGPFEKGQSNGFQERQMARPG